MKQLFVWLSIAGALVFFGGSDWAQGSSPESVGAHWARVPDGAQIGFVLDEVQAVARGQGSEAVARKLLAPNLSLSSLIHAQASAPFPRDKTASQTAIDGESAVSNVRGASMSFERRAGKWILTGGALPPPAMQATISRTVAGNGASVGETFVATPVSREHNIDRLTRNVTRERISRTLFGTPDKTASYYYAHYTNTAPFVTATYIQFVTDPSWNRIIYGNMDHWIKSYDDVKSPSSIAVDPDGRVFIGENGNRRITVLKITGEGANATLQPQFTVDDIENPTDIAQSDNGTPLDISDDILYVADASRNTVSKYALGATSANLAAKFDGFDSPTSIATGRWNGATNGLVYVVDHLGKRIRVYDDLGTQLSLIREVDGNYTQYFKSLKVDHFGNVYAVDNVNSRVFKFTSSLELLDTQGGDDTFAALGNIDIPFGKIVVDGQGTYWAGFDQLFAVERWSDGSGAQRRTLGLKMKDIGFSADDDVSMVRNTFTLTDFGKVNVRISDAQGHTVRTLTDVWMVSGQKQLDWDRRSDDGRLVPPGTYRYDVTAVQTYRDDPLVSEARISLPLYYHEDCGSTTPSEDAHVTRGTPVQWGATPSQSAEEDPTSVVYTFVGLDPASEYEVAAEYTSNDDVARLQDMTVNGIRLHDPVGVSRSPVKTDYITLPRESYAGGTAALSINARGEGSAIVSQLWIKETGKGFTAQEIDNPIPQAYRLEQNYPNPFNPATTIRYALPNDGPVTLKVFDIMGRQVATLVNEQKTAGTYEIRFDARSSSGTALASGVYFYQLRAGTFTDTKKLLLLK